MKIKLFGLFALLALLALSLVVCKNGTDPTPQPMVTVTKTVTVSFPAFTTNSKTLSFAPTYTPDGNDWGNFSASDITYTVTCTELSKTFDSGNNFTANSTTDGYEQYILYTFTQIFKNSSGTVIGNQVIKTLIGQTGFLTLHDANNVALGVVNDVIPNTQYIPDVTLTLIKQVPQ